MADPFTLATIGIGASAGSGLIGGIGNIMSGEAQAGQAGYQAAVARANQQIALQNRDYAYAAGEVEAGQYGMQAAQRMGNLKVRQGSSGIDIGSGSSQDVQKSLQTVSDIDLAQLRANTARKAYGYETQSIQFGAQADMYSKAQSNISAAIPLNVAGSLLSGAGSVSSRWLQASQSGAFDSNPYSG